MVTKTEHSATIEVGDAEYSFDRSCVEGDGNMAVTVCLTEIPEHAHGHIAEAVADSSLELTESASGEKFLTFTSESDTLDYEEMETVLAACVAEDDGDRYQLVACESPWGPHIGLITLW